MNDTKDIHTGGKKALIEVKNVRKSFPTSAGSVEVLKGINLEVYPGEFTIIFGPSGCGKSTLLHCCLGLEVPTEGTITIDTKDFYKMTEDERALFRRHKVGMIYQQPLWIGSLNVGENVAFPLRLLDEKDQVIEERVRQSLALVGLEKWEHYKPTELSSGQQQKISLARALMIDPIIIVADEPTGNLDTQSGQELLDTFIKLTQQGKTIIMVTHDLEYLKYATRIIHMIDGEVVEQQAVRGKKHFKMSGIKGKKELTGQDTDATVRDKNYLSRLKL